jgi:hypothetical protein
MKSTLPRALLAALAAGWAGVALIGCHNGVADRVDNRLDCKAICDTYADCIDDDTNVDKCKDDCRDNALKDDDFEHKVDRCSDCVTADDSCVDKTFECASDCVGIVPPPP